MSGLLLCACTKKEVNVEPEKEMIVETTAPDEPTPPEITSITTPDEAMTFHVINEGNYSDAIIEFVSNQLLTTYDYLKNETFKSFYTHADNVDVYLREGYSTSYGARYYILLYKDELTNFPH